VNKLESLFGANGNLAAILPNYVPRPAQSAMAQAIEAAIADQHCLIAEAGTGTGKTLAYLVPAILSGQRVIVSTGTRNLQDQLFKKDLPTARKALGVPFQAALLKGRANYLCHYRLENVLGFNAGYSAQDAAHLESLMRWSKTTRAGDIAEVIDVPENSVLWRAVTSTPDNCLGQDCPAYARCCPAAARKKAHDADVLVINHHLLWADWVLKSDGFGELLPKADVIIVDEAHQFAESASQFLGANLSSRQIEDLAGDIQVELNKVPGELPALSADAAGLSETIAALRLGFGAGAERRAWEEVLARQEVEHGFRKLQTQLGMLSRQLIGAAARTKGLESCCNRSRDLMDRLGDFLHGDDSGAIRWIEVYRQSFRLNRTPIEIASDFTEFYNRSKATWIFTSATLSSGGRFDHFIRLLGLDEPQTFRCESPFDYRRQCLIYIPTGLPDPASPDYTRRVVESSLPVLAASRGRAFLLFTSRHALNAAGEQLQTTVDYPLFVQGSGSKNALLERFRRSGNGVLLGTASFWEGVDVRGPALSCVVIDKLPFASPSDPVLHARIRAIKARGDDPFRTSQLPSAVLSLKQGFGRLIRDGGDRGVMVLCDPRILTRSYGKAFLDSLPPVRITRLLGDVEAFFAEH